VLNVWPLSLHYLVPFFHGRLVQNIRDADGSSNATGVLSQVWDFNLEERDAEFKDDLRAASGIGRRKGGKVKFTVLSFLDMLDLIILSTSVDAARVPHCLHKFAP
jgi:hypothetical protein